ncbi:MAG: hypothetical protein LUG24_05875 [Clostridiales bacterium]|nr:hypothetical protein [Clostridiales bacterium]
MKTKKIAEAVKGFFKTNISIKIFSFVFAFVMWFLVLSTLNPSETKTYSVSLTVNGMEDLEANDLVCMNLDSIIGQSVKIKIEAARPDLTTLDSNKDKLTASVDLGRFSDYYNEDLTEDFIVSVIPNLSLFGSTYEIVGYSPTAISLELDRLVEFDVPTRVIVQNEPQENYVRNEPTAALSTVTVKGPETLKDTIAYAGLIVDLSQVTGDDIASVEPVLFDNDGNVVTDERFAIYEEYVQVSTSVLRQGDVRVELSGYEGVAETGYSVTDVIYSPETIRVLGNNIPSEAIVLPSVNIEGASENVIETFDIQPLLAERGLMAASEEYLNVTVEIVVERQDPAILKIDGSGIVVMNLAEGYYLSSELNDVSFELYGNRDLIDSSDITAYINLEGYTAGTHRVRVYPVLPSGISTVENEYIYVEIAEETEETTEETTEAASEDMFSEAVTEAEAEIEAEVFETEISEAEKTEE